MGAWDEFETPENETPEYWNPTEPAKVRGTIVKFDTFKDEEGNSHPQVLLDVDGTTVTVTGFRKLLRDALLNLVKVEGAKEGDVAEVEFKGKAQGKRYYLYDAKLIGAPAKREVDAKEEF